jgi:mRNA interferase RelE/StbE
LGKRPRYNVLLKPSVEKDFRHVPAPNLAGVWQRIEALTDKPLPRQSTKRAGAEHSYRQRVRDYRVVYSVDHPAKQVIVRQV